eukprot:COSAG06_NODE_2887_length_6130_cov_5.068611_9_plen_63_part_00
MRLRSQLAPERSSVAAGGSPDAASGIAVRATCVPCAVVLYQCYCHLLLFINAIAMMRHHTRG